MEEGGIVFFIGLAVVVVLWLIAVGMYQVTYAQRMKSWKHTQRHNRVTEMAIRITIIMFGYAIGGVVVLVIKYF